MFELWFEASRWTFNKAKEICDALRDSEQKIPGMEQLRDIVLASLPERFAQVPYLIKAGGAIDYYIARCNAIKKSHKGLNNGTSPKSRFVPRE